MRVMRRPGFVPGLHGSLFMLQVLPAEAAGTLGVVMLAAFAEEMNRCRRMFALQAGALAAAGMPTLLLDYFGTGDSDGDFGAARLEIWRDDCLRAANVLRDSGCRSIAWLGVRFGALLALEAAPRVPDSIGIVLWQPTHSGKQLVIQQLRILTAAQMGGGSAGRPASDFKSELSAGKSIEIAGYELSASLVEELEALSLDAHKCGALPLAWYEVSAATPPELSVASRRIVESWKQSGIRVEAEAMLGDAFWSTSEVTLAPALIERTTTTLRRWQGNV